MSQTSKYAPSFKHWNLWDKIKFFLEEYSRVIYWGLFRRKERERRKVFQQTVVYKINKYFKTGWRLFGQGPLPWCDVKWSDAWINTLFAWTDRIDNSNSSYHYRIGCTDHEGEYGIYCHSTNEIFHLCESSGSDENIYLTIAAASIGLIVDKENWESDRIDVIKERIAAAENLVAINT